MQNEWHPEVRWSFENSSLGAAAAAAAAVQMESPSGSAAGGEVV